MATQGILTPTIQLPSPLHPSATVRATNHSAERPSNRARASISFTPLSYTDLGDVRARLRRRTRAIAPNPRAARDAGSGTEL